MTDDDGLAALEDAHDRAEDAVEAFDDGSTPESVAENVVAWAARSLTVAQRSLSEETDDE